MRANRKIAGLLLAAFLGGAALGAPGTPWAEVTTVGKDKAAARIADGTSTPAIFNYVAIGTSSTAFSVGQTACQAEVGTRVQDTDADAGSTGVVILISTFAAGNPATTQTIREICLLNASSSGDMFSRRVISDVTKTSTDSLQVTITITVS